MPSLSITPYHSSFIWTLSGMAKPFTTADGYEEAGITRDSSDRWDGTKTRPSVFASVSAPSSGGNKYATGAASCSSGNYTFYAYAKAQNGTYYSGGSASVTVHGDLWISCEYDSSSQQILVYVNNLDDGDSVSITAKQGDVSSVASTGTATQFYSYYTLYLSASSMYDGVVDISGRASYYVASTKSGGTPYNERVSVVISDSVTITNKPKNVRPDEYYWADHGVYMAKDAPITNLTASAWNALVETVAAFRKYCGYSSKTSASSFSYYPVTSGATMTAAIVNEVFDAVKEMQDSGYASTKRLNFSNRAVANTTQITAKFFDDIVYTLNSVYAK